MLRIVVVDLNNFARFPTLPVGLIVALLRGAGHEVTVLSPLAVGLVSLPRGQRAKPWGYLDERLRWWSATSPSPLVRGARARLGRWRAAETGAPSEAVVHELERVIAGAEVVLVSAYTQYEALVRRLGEVARAAGVPFVVGGPAFTDRGVQQAWLDVPGLTALFAGEVEPALVELVEGVASGAAPFGPAATSGATPFGPAATSDATPFGPGIATPATGPVDPAPPLHDLDRVPFPDYRDFPWDRYPNRVVSMLASRGCGWGVCTFCGDVLTANGRGFRARSAANVLAELAFHHRELGVDLFCFSDLKLNSDVALWRGLHEGFQAAVPGARWTAAVHVGGRGDQGLSREDLRNARAAGLVRVTTGLESGSQRVLDRMAKGTEVARTEAFLRDAHEAGISVRTTLFTGYPGETAEDVLATAALLERNVDAVERVSLSRFLVLPGTPIATRLAADPELARDLAGGGDERSRSAPYRRAIARLLRATHRINRKPLREAARPLEGAM